MHQSIGFQEKTYLLHRAGYGGKYVACIGADKPNRTYSNGQDHRQHDGVLRDVLSGFPTPQLVHYSHCFYPRNNKEITQGRVALSVGPTSLLGHGFKYARL
jgi:hypothetical protein